MSGKRQRAQVETAVCLSLTAVAVTFALLLPDGDLPSGNRHLRWWALTVLFALAGLARVRVQIRRRVTSVVLSEAILVIGIFSARPLDVVIGATVGSVVATVGRGERRIGRILQTIGIDSVAVGTAVTVFLALHPSQVPDRSGWVAACVAGGVYVVAEFALVTVVLTLVEGKDRSAPWHTLGVELLVAAALLPGSLTAAVAMHHDVGAGLLGLLTFAFLTLFFNVYTQLADRYVGLERLYRFSRIVGSEPEIDDVLRRTLLQSRDLLHARHSELIFCRSGDVAAVRLTLDPHDRLERELLEPLAVPAWAYLGDDGVRVVRQEGHSQGLVVAPLRGESTVIGVLAVGHRDASATGDFSDADARLLETYANHAGSDLLKGQLLARLQHESLHDPLTGLANRVRFEQLLTHLLDQEGEVAVLVLDLDSFKEVNDTLGHASGDLLLQEVGRRIGLIAQQHPVARLGADEFAVAVSGLDEQRDYEEWARALNAAIQAPVRLDDAEFEISASIGIAMAPAQGTAAMELLKRADIARYAAKASTGSVRVYTPAMDSHTPQRLALIRDLRKALEMGHLLLHFQPQISLQTGQVLGCEALVRWQHPERGLITPDEFIPSAERSGLIRPLTRVILANAVATCAAWRAAGLDIGVSVNVSARSLIDNELVTDVAAVLLRQNLPASRLTIEVTESSVMGDPERVRQTLDRLGALGVTVAIDDFGTGQTSLAYLQDLPVQEVKIDKSFVIPMLSDPGRHAITKAIIDLGRTLGMRVVAEGVEDHETMLVLAALGCDAAQGYYLARPLAGSAVPGWVDGWRQEAGPWSGAPLLTRASAR